LLVNIQNTLKNDVPFSLVFIVTVLGRISQSLEAEIFQDV
jgi:hypothetical protein